MSDETERGRARAVWPLPRTPFFYLKAVGGLFFLLSLSATVCAGLLFNDMRALRARMLPESWEEMMLGHGLPQGPLLALSIVAALSFAGLAAIVYLFAAVSERILRSR
jgi:hypothetical protein